MKDFAMERRRKKSLYSELFWSPFFLDFPAFGLNTERYCVLINWENPGKMWTRITPNTVSFYAMKMFCYLTSPLFLQCYKPQ